MGGRSREHEISLKTGKFMYQTLQEPTFLKKPILIDQQGMAYYPSQWNLDWLVSDDHFQNIGKDPFVSERFCEDFVQSYHPTPIEYWKDATLGGCDVLLLALHGGEGEDGRIQSFLEIAGTPYTGSNSTASFLAMDKYSSGLIFQQNGLQVPPFFTIHRREWEEWMQRDHLHWKEFCRWKNTEFDFPVFTKPRFGGSSVNTFSADHFSEWIGKLKDAFQKEDSFLIQKSIQGREVSCGVLEIPDGSSWKPIALPPTEIIPFSSFFDYESKYKKGASEEITPPQMPKEWIESIQKASLLAHKILGCSSYSRTDFLVTEDGTPWILETNTLPGMTETSLLPQQANKAGYSMDEILKNLVLQAWERKGIPKA